MKVCACLDNLLSILSTNENHWNLGHIHFLVRYPDIRRPTIVCVCLSLILLGNDDSRLCFLLPRMTHFCFECCIFFFCTLLTRSSSSYSSLYSSPNPSSHQPSFPASSSLPADDLLLLLLLLRTTVAFIVPMSAAAAVSDCMAAFSSVHSSSIM